MSETHDLLLLRSFFEPTLLPLAGRLIKAPLITTIERRSVLAVLMGMYSTGESITPETARLGLSSAFNEADDISARRVAEIMAEPPLSEHDLKALVSSATIQNDRAARRSLGAWLQSDEGQRASIQQVNAKLQEQALRLSQLAPSRHETFLEGLSKLLKRPKPTNRYTLGFGRLDEKFVIYPSSFNVVMADSGAGKSSFMFNSAMNLARMGVNSYIMSFEMPEEDCHMRMAGIATGVPCNVFDDGDIPLLVQEQVRHVIEQNRQVFSRIHVFRPDGRSCEVIQAKQAEIMAEYGEGVMWIDYLQTMTGTARHVHDTVSLQQHVSTTLTQASFTTGMPIIALSQVTTNAVGMDKLKGSKQAKHDAWQMLLLVEQEGVSNADDPTEVILMAHHLKGRKRGRFRAPLPIVYHQATQRMFYTDQIHVD